MRSPIIALAVFGLVACAGQTSVTPRGMDAQAQVVHPASNYHVVYNFKGSDGSQPGHGPLVVLGQKLYGTTHYGGAHGRGTVFELAADGSERVLHSFAGGKGDGSNPRAGLAVLDGALYGTTENAGSAGSGYGTAFEVTTDGKERVIYNFDGYNGAYPFGALFVDAGVLYGTTRNYGKEFDGTLFALTTGGQLKVLFAFGRKGAGANPYAGPQFFGGKIYGTTLFGPADEDLSGLVYQQTVNGRPRWLHKFALKPGDGAMPQGRLAMLDGILYGTTDKGGAKNEGTIYKLTTEGDETVLHSFERATGSGSVAGLVAYQGALYGETVRGGHSDFGVIFKITPGGTCHVLHEFYGPDGHGGTSELTVWNGKLYGTTFEGGAHQKGTVFEITP